jgi:hypothetical protein
LENFIINQHQVIIQGTWEFIRPNANALAEKWLLCNMLWIQIGLYGNYVMKHHGNPKNQPFYDVF